MKVGLAFSGKPLEESDFTDYIRKVDYLTHAPQIAFVTDGHRMLPDIHIYKFEEIEDSWIRICKTLNIQEELPHVNKTSHRHYSSYYTDETRDIVAEFSEVVIQMMGYEFLKLPVDN